MALVGKWPAYEPVTLAVCEPGKFIPAVNRTFRSGPRMPAAANSTLPIIVGSNRGDVRVIERRFHQARPAYRQP